MARRIIESEYERRMLLKFIEGQKLPLTVTVQAVGKRSAQQNRLNRQWMLDIEAQLDGWTAYLDAIHQHFSEQGVVLTNPDDMKFGRAA